MRSKWEPGTRVRVKATVSDGTAGLVGVIERVDYAQTQEATSVLIDEATGLWSSNGAFYYDGELEAE
ncbi:hypothetical protein ACFYW9_19405 [Streptomyces sp. NPDC002698]|uniref:hypothetical protein n=1 Tax=Streptomyces sp. NPDC002698 TaxID=3364660 RepID=UPI0036BA5BDD